MLLAGPLTGFILQALSESPKRQATLQRESDYPAQTTLRAQLKHLIELGAIEKHRRDRFPGALEYELTDSGRDLLRVANILARWLERAPDRPLQPGSNAAKAAIKALAEGWSSTMLRALAAGPLSLTQLDSLISSLSYPSLERRLGAMRRTHLVAPRPGSGRSTPHTVTDWAREAVAPLAAATSWEQRHLAGTAAPIAGLDVEAAFLLGVPLLQADAEVSGACRLAVELANGQRRRLAGVTLKLQSGRVSSCATDLRASADAWAVGPPPAWFGALIERQVDRLELGGDRRVALAVIDSVLVTQHDVSR